jgi:hypothetical protein
MLRRDGAIYGGRGRAHAPREDDLESALTHARQEEGMLKPTGFWLAGLVGSLFSLTAAANAQLSLMYAEASLAQPSTAQWSLSKTGVVNTAASTVTWTVAATKSPTNATGLVADGYLWVANEGTSPAPIGNIVVNLQVRSGKQWATLASNVANATDGDDATSAFIAPRASSEGRSSFTESGASGSLSFTDANANTVFSLVPQRLVAPYEHIALRYQATFDNNILAIPAGSPVRLEVLVSFGNSAPNPASATNVDIDGDGVIEPSEARVRTVAARNTVTVPASGAYHQIPTLSDTLDDIETTGTVALGNVQFNLGATGGTIVAAFTPGAEGGSITNCAQLTSPAVTVTQGGFTSTIVPALDLEDCDTQTINPPRTCTPGAPGCGWLPGDIVTLSQSDWDVSTFLNEFLSVYGSPGVEVGIPGPTGFSMTFSSATRVRDYMPASGTVGVLTTDLLNPTISASGAFGGEVLALRLNVDFSELGLLGGTAAVPFGSVRLCNHSIAGLNNKTVSEISAIMNQALGGELTGHSIGSLSTLAAQLNASFGLGAVSTFAQQHLVNGACPSGPWQAGDLVTHTQGAWGLGGDNVATLLDTSFGALYFSTGGVLEVGIIGSTGFSIRLTSASAVRDYLPAIGTAAALTNDVVNPSTTAAGILGGEVVGLALNIDFGAADLLGGTAPVALGSLSICGVSGLPSMTVNNFRQLVNDALGGAATGYPAALLATTAAEINLAFAGGTTVSDFAQQHLVNGACPP